MFNYKKLIFIIVSTFLIGSLFTFFTGTDIYNEIVKPPFAPPNIVFPIVWSVIYILISISLYLVLEEKKDNDLSLFYYSVQLFFNSTWTLIFFGFKNFFISFIWIMILIVCIIKMFIEFYQIKKSAGLLIIPYIVWSFIALYLNIGIYVLN